MARKKRTVSAATKRKISLGVKRANRRKSSGRKKSGKKRKK